MEAKNSKILIIGAGGMLGHDLAEVFAEHHPTLWDFEDIDITDENQVIVKLGELKPNLVINAAAYTNVDGAEGDSEKAFLVNAEAVGYLAKTCKKLDALLVHFSTEYVFDGKDQAGYQEDSKTNPLNVYGQSKAKGEELLMQNCDNHYLVRTSWLYGRSPQKGKPRGLNFVQTMLELAKQGKELNVVNDQFGRPTYTLDLAKAVKGLVDNQAEYGIYHLVNEGDCSWYDFAKEIFATAQLEAKLHPIGSSEYPMPTPRPQYAVLHNTKADKLRNWQEALKEYIAEVKNI